MEDIDGNSLVWNELVYRDSGAIQDKAPHISEFVTDSSIAHNMLLNWKGVLTKLKLGIPKLIFPQ